MRPLVSHSSAANAPTQRILIRGVNWLGDAVMTTPALQRLREARPNAQITLLTHAKLADLWQYHPSVDAVLTFSDSESVFAVGRKVRAQGFDLALILPNSPRSALEVFLGRIPIRLGYARPWRNLLLTQRVSPRPEAVPMKKRSVAEVRALVTSPSPASRTTFPHSAHHIYDYLHLVAALGADPKPVPPRLRVTDEEVTLIRRRFELPGTDGKRPLLLGLNVGAEYGPAKRWPAERFIEAAVTLQRKSGCHCWILGGKGDAELATRVSREIQAAGVVPHSAVRSLAGATTLRELCAALKACDLLLTNDTGPMHVAAAVGTPMVVLFGSTSPELTAPGLPGDPRQALLIGEAACAPCFLRECPIDFRCMKSITVASVIEAAWAVLQRGAARTRCP